MSMWTRWPGCHCPLVAYAIGRKWNLQFDSGPLEPGLAQRARLLAGEKYGSDHWTRRR